MGWNTSALFASGRSAGELLDSLPDQVDRVPTAQVPAEQATLSHPGGRVYLAERAGWSQLWDPELSIVPGLDDPAGPTGTGRVLAVVFSSVSSTYGFWLHEDGALVRRAIYTDGEPVDTHGTPLPFEAAIPVPSWGHDEDFVWAVIRAVTGQEYDPGQRFAVHPVTR